MNTNYSPTAALNVILTSKNEAEVHFNDFKIEFIRADRVFWPYKYNVENLRAIRRAAASFVKQRELIKERTLDDTVDAIVRSKTTREDIYWGFVHAIHEAVMMVVDHLEDLFEKHSDMEPEKYYGWITPVTITTCEEKQEVSGMMVQAVFMSKEPSFRKTAIELKNSKNFLKISGVHEP